MGEFDWGVRAAGCELSALTTTIAREWRRRHDEDIRPIGKDCAGSCRLWRMIDIVVYISLLAGRTADHSFLVH